MRIRALFAAVFAVVSLTSLAVVSPVLAQAGQPVSLKDVRLSIWPEYDDLAQLGHPSILVVLEGEIVSDNVPALIRFRIPSDAVMYLAGSGPRDEYVAATPVRKASNTTGWDELSFELMTRHFVVEYYAPVGSQPDRVIPYDFHTFYPVSNLRAEIQEPKRSRSFKVSPEGLVNSDDNGFRYHIYDYANVSPDAPLHFDISYSKADSRPSLDNSAGTGLPITAIFIVVGVIIVLAAAIFVVFRLKSSSPTVGARSQRRRATRVARGSQASARGKYCSHCGKAIQDVGRFCAYCGNELD